MTTRNSPNTTISTTLIIPTNNTIPNTTTISNSNTSSVNHTSLSITSTKTIITSESRASFHYISSPAVLNMGDIANVPGKELKHSSENAENSHSGDGDLADPELTFEHRDNDMKLRNEMNNETHLMITGVKSATIRPLDKPRLDDLSTDIMRLDAVLATEYKSPPTIATISTEAVRIPEYDDAMPLVTFKPTLQRLWNPSPVPVSTSSSSRQFLRVSSIPVAGDPLADFETTTADAINVYNIRRDQPELSKSVREVTFPDDNRRHKLVASLSNGNSGKEENVYHKINEPVENLAELRRHQSDIVLPRRVVETRSEMKRSDHELALSNKDNENKSAQITTDNDNDFQLTEHLGPVKLNSVKKVNQNKVLTGVSNVVRETAVAGDNVNTHNIKVNAFEVTTRIAVGNDDKSKIELHANAIKFNTNLTYLQRFNSNSTG